MNPSQFEIQREVEALRDIRRRSTAGGPGALVLDPDLPNPSSLSANQHNYWDANKTSSDESSSSDHDGSSESGDPTSLFWVPAHLHPEIAPAEFREFIKEHARTSPDGSVSLERSKSTGLDRKKSMLNREYKPSANDGVENEGQYVPVRRSGSRLVSNPGPELTISDLQQLDELANDPTKLRTVLRRSLTLNVSPSAMDKMDNMPDLGDEADAPIIVPRPGQVLRRSARTKIKKPGQAPGGAHTFTSRSRRISEGRASAPEIPDMPSNYQNPHISYESLPLPEQPAMRPESYSEESFIYDSYLHEDSDDINAAPILVTAQEPPLPSSSHLPEFEFPSSAPLPPLLHPIPQQPHLAPPASPLFSRTPSPESPPEEASLLPRSSDAYSLQHPLSPSPSQRSEGRKEKDKKGLFSKYTSGKKGAKEKEPKEKEKEKEKEGASFIRSWFVSKKKQDDSTNNGLGHGSGRETAAALLGASKSSKNPQSPSPSSQGGPYARYPIHVERAIYRLSHIKLANPRRPLYEQVLISNLMFWYLGVINKTQNGPEQGNQQDANGGADIGKEQRERERERERREQEEREKAERERLEREREREREQREKEMKRESKRGTLTKASSVGSPGPRKAEMPVRGPQYGMQHRVMEQEYGYNGQNSNSGRSPTGSFPMLVQPQPQQASSYYYMGGNQSNPPQIQPSPRASSPGRPTQLLPGAIPPVAEEMWSSTTSSQRPSSTPPSNSPQGHPNVPRRERSPPAQNRYTPAPEKHSSGAKLAGRSLSANAVPSQSNGKLRKGNSAHAVLAAAHVDRTSNDEDMPLGLWQQRRK